MSLLLLGVLADFLIGDPQTWPHPVRLMGRIISWEEKGARKIFKSSLGLKLAGLLMLLINISLAFLLPGLLLFILSPYRYLYRLVYVYLVFSCLAARNLSDESLKVGRALDDGLEEARYKLSFIVGRETDKLDREGIIKATVETVSENTSDGVIAPLFYMLLLGPLGGLAYKFINTMDSMVAYKNDDYKDLGYFPALVDDLVNLVPARLTGLLMVLSSLGKFDWKEGWKIMIRDRRKHASPNAGYPEAATAGLLGIQLGGGGFYGGVFEKKPSLGDPRREAETEDIKRSVEIMYRTEVLLILLALVVYFI